MQYVINFLSEYFRTFYVEDEIDFAMSLIYLAGLFLFINYELKLMKTKTSTKIILTLLTIYGFIMMCAVCDCRTWDTAINIFNIIMSVIVFGAIAFVYSIYVGSGKRK